MLLRHIRSLFSIRRPSILTVLALCFALPLSSVAPASASPVLSNASSTSVIATVAPTSSGVVAVPMLATRPGQGFGQYDVLLDSYDTASAAKSWWAGSVLCWNAGLAWNPPLYGSCLALLTVCAARAYVTGQRAGMTVTIWNSGWCWKY